MNLTLDPRYPNRITEFVGQHVESGDQTGIIRSARFFSDAVLVLAVERADGSVSLWRECECEIVPESA